MSVADVSKTDFGLGLGLGPCLRDKLNFTDSCSGEPTLTLGLGRTANTNKSCQSKSCLSEAVKSTELTDRLHQQSSPTPSATIPSFSNSSSIKKERDSGQEDEMDPLVVQSPRASDEDEIGYPRKKLRLRKEQSAVLEESFREHPTLNPRQKQELARKLNLQARQVEVWFQNRRARTKLKQTEVDCQLLKKCCEKLAEENKRLHKELHELKSLKLIAANPKAYSMQLPTATLTVCPSCERIGGDTHESSPIISNTASAGSKVQRHLYKNNPFRHY